MKDIDKQIREAMSLHRGGKLAEGSRLYEAILSAEPKNFEAL